jgi:GNAT superfamily N-acetyltransferase
MNFERDGFLISTEPEWLDLDFICHGLNGTYWAKNRPRAVIEEAIRNSVCFGLYEQEGRKQVGFARIVTDGATFSWLCDVFVDGRHRRKGLGKWLISCVTAHPTVKATVCLLGTLDAHGLYEQYGFVRSEQMKRMPGKETPPQASLPRQSSQGG